MGEFGVGPAMLTLEGVVGRPDQGDKYGQISLRVATCEMHDFSISLYPMLSPSNAL